MADFVFVLPLTKDELLVESGEPEDGSKRENQYMVKKLLGAKQIDEGLRNVHRLASTEGPDFILENFDLFYSCIVNYALLDADQKHSAWSVLHDGFTEFILILSKTLQSTSGQALSENGITKTLNVLKMLSYAFCHFVRCLETESANPALDVSSLARGRAGKGAKKKSNNEIAAEPFDRDKSLLAMYQILQLPLGKLWSPAISPESNFLKLFTDCVCKALENPSLGYVRSKDTRNSIFEILGSLIQRYNQGETVTHRLTELINTSEKSVPALIAGVPHLLEVTHYQTLMGQILCLGQRFGSSVLDTDTVRNLSTFLTGLAEQSPEIFLSHLPLLPLLLDEKNASLRGAVCTVIGEVVAHCLTDEGLPSNRRHQRDSLLNLLLDHVHDKNAHVRSRALRCWSQLSSNKAIPLSYLQQLLPRTIGRLKDASSMVRKQSLLLLKALIEENPFGPLLISEPDLSRTLAEEEIKLQTMTGSTVDAASAGKQSRQLQWDKMEAELLENLEEASEDDVNEEITVLPEAVNWANLIQMVVAALDQMEGLKAMRILCFFVLKNPKIRQGVLAWMDFDLEDTNLGPIPEVEPNQWLSVLRLLYVERELLLEEEQADEQPEQEPPESQLNTQKQKHIVDFYRSMKSFGEAVTQVLDVLAKLLYSKQVSDSQSAISLIISASRMNVAYATPCVRAMLPLVLSKEPNIQECILEAFKTLYLQPVDQSKAAISHVVKQLCALPRGATVGELICLQELLAMCLAVGDLSTPIIQRLWQCFLHGTDASDSFSALQILSMAAGGDGDLVRRNVEVLIQEGLGPRSEKDLRWALYTCKMLLNFNAKKHEAPVRLSVTHRLFERLIELLSEALDSRQEFFTPFAVRAVELLFEVSQDPLVVMEKMLRSLQQKLGWNQSHKGPMQCDTFALSSLVSVVGEAAYRFQLFLEGPVLTRVKKMAADKEVEDKEQRQIKMAKTNLQIRSPSSSTRKRVPKGKDTEEDDELMGAVAFDPEEEIIQQAMEMSVSNSKALFSAYVPFLASLLADTNTNKMPHVQAAAVVALAKCCLLNVQVCDQHLQLVFSLMAKSPIPGIRSNAIVAATQLYFRFPNQVDPWAGHLFSRLRDESAEVRLCVLERITELVLQDMMKIKGQASEVARCLVDSDPQVARTAELFFEEFSQKGNALYNVIPDLVSRLSSSENPISDEDFTLIFTAVLYHIKNDKQGDAHAAKLLLRLCVARDPSQLNKLCICLQKLPVSPKGLKGILDCWKDLQSNIGLEIVQETLRTMLAMAKKSKAEAYKGLIEEVEAKLATIESGAEGEEDGKVSGNERDENSSSESSSSALEKPREPRRSNRGNDKTTSTVPKRTSARPSAAKKKPQRPRQKFFCTSDEEDSDY